MEGDAGAAAAAADPFDRDAATAPPAEDIKCDERALGKDDSKQEEGAEQQQQQQPAAATTNAPGASAAAPPPPARNGGPFSSTVIPRTVDAIADDHFKRRSAILSAITEDQDAFFAACDPTRENLCLYGEPDGRTWMVASPADEVPPEVPEPCLGINFARDGMRRSDWVSLVAVHSDAWLRSVAWYFGARLDKQGRAELFARMNSRPTLYEVATGRSRSGTTGKQARKAAAAAAAAAEAATAAGKNTSTSGASLVAPPPPPAPATRQPGADPDAGVVLGAGGARAAAAPLATGRLLTESDVSDSAFALSLACRRCELLWPDDGLWYLVEILEVDPRAATARARYSSGEEEVLSLLEVAEKRELSLLAD